MPWYDGPSLLHHLEHVHIASDRNLIDVRFPVQYVIRPHQATDPELHDYRGYAGQVAGGVLKPGDEVMHLPSGLTTTIERIDTARGPVPEAYSPMSVTLVLEDDLDISRGDLICRPHNQPLVSQDVEAHGLLDVRDQDAGRAGPAGGQAHHAHGQGHRPRPALPARREHAAPGRDAPTSLRLNEVGRVSLRLTQPLFCDPYNRNRQTGGLILIDEATNATVGAAMITEGR